MTREVATPAKFNQAKVYHGEVAGGCQRGINRGNLEPHLGQFHMEFEYKGQMMTDSFWMLRLSNGEWEPRFHGETKAEVEVELGESPYRHILQEGDYTIEQVRVVPIEGEPIDGQFAEFWEVYPKRNGKKLYKKSAEKKFLALNQGDRVQCILAAKNYANSRQAKDGFAKDPDRFIKGRYGQLWKDWLEPEPTWVPPPFKRPEEVAPKRSGLRNFTKERLENANMPVERMPVEGILQRLTERMGMG